MLYATVWWGKKDIPDQITKDTLLVKIKNVIVMQLSSPVAL